MLNFFIRYDIAFIDPPIRTSKERKEAAYEVSKYLNILTPEERELPGFEGKLAKWDRHRHGKAMKTKIILIFYTFKELTVMRFFLVYFLAMVPL